MSELKQEVYKATFETWRYEVNSYWQRNSYFAAFEVAALAGCWYVAEQRHHFTGLAFSILGLLTAVIWLLTSVAVHRYIDYWWKSAQAAEKTLPLRDEGLDFATRHPGSKLRPSTLVHTIPVLFGLAWILISLFEIWSLWRLKVPLHF
jgi:hypothetical protein